MVIDIEKIEAARKGDKDSFAQVYQSISSDLYKVAYYALGNSHDAEDAVSEAFVEAYKSIAKLRDAGSFKPWMMKILSIRCKRKIAEYVKGKAVFDIEGFMTTLADETDVSANVSEQITVMNAMSRLNHQERLIVVLSVFSAWMKEYIWLGLSRFRMPLVPKATQLATTAP